MATVTLPFGYPAVSGTPLGTIIYQGRVAKLYSVPVDPRTTTQAFQRRMWADLNRVRSTIGAYARGAARATLDTKWSSNVVQLLKADDQGCWTDAVNAWNGATEGEKDEWRAVAPYQATYNDPGEMFFLFARALMSVLQNFAGTTWRGDVWGTEQASDAAAWWAWDIASHCVTGKVNENFVLIDYGGTWTVRSGDPDYGSTIRDTTEAGVQWCEVIVYGNRARVGYRKDMPYGVGHIVTDRDTVTEINQYAGSPVWQQETIIDFDWTGVHRVRLQRVTDEINIDFFQAETV